MLANSPGGIDGQVSKAWKQATDPAVSGPSNDPRRLTETSSGRARYWREAMKVHAQAPWLGTGAGAYGTLRLRYRVDERNVRHAHGFVVQTLADLGWVGLALSLFATGAWIRAAMRGTGMRRKDRGLHWDAERVGIATLATVVLVFGIHSTVDWTWFVPANALPALICAGWVASRPSLRARLIPGAPEEPRPGLPLGLRLALGSTILVVAVLACWSSLQPIRSIHAQEAALARFEVGALPAAASIAEIAHDRNPLAVEPLFELAAIQQAQRRNREALQTLERAIDLEPANPETWRRLGQTRLNLGDAKGALAAFQAAYYLDPKSARSMSDVILAARAEAAAR
jgi:tetratricopeptide (TPR) repeat protein